jgi:hypothetical protein
VDLLPNTNPEVEPRKARKAREQKTPRKAEKRKIIESKV